MGYGFVDKHTHMSMGRFIQVGGLILLHVIVLYEYAMLGSLQTSLYSHLSCISNLVFTCGLVLKFILAVSSCLAANHDFRI